MNSTEEELLEKAQGPCGVWRRCCCSQPDEHGEHCWGCGYPKADHQRVDGQECGFQDAEHSETPTCQQCCTSDFVGPLDKDFRRWACRDCGLAFEPDGAQKK